LHIYGNTRESDLIEYGISVSSQTVLEIKNVLDEMIVKSWIKRIIHDKLDSKVIYVTTGSLPLDLALSIEASALEVKDKEKKIAEAKRILKEAEVIAKKRFEEKFPELKGQNKHKDHKNSL
jgi:hypothetical protein